MLNELMPVDFTCALYISFTCKTLYYEWPPTVQTLPPPIEAIIPYDVVKRFKNLVSLNLKRRPFWPDTPMEFPKLKFIACHSSSFHLSSLIAPELQEAYVATSVREPLTFPKLVSLGCVDTILPLPHLTKLEVFTTSATLSRNWSSLTSLVSLHLCRNKLPDFVNVGMICYLSNLTDLSIYARLDISRVLMLPKLQKLHVPNCTTSSQVISTSLTSLGIMGIELTNRVGPPS
jgi:hypothetical protein